MEPEQHTTTLNDRQADFKSKGLATGLPQKLFAQNRAQFIRMMKESIKANCEGDLKKPFGFFKGANLVPMYSSDVDYPEYQEAFFYYLFGAPEMDCFGVIDFANEKTILFVPRLDNFYKIWMTAPSLEEW